MPHRIAVLVSFMVQGGAVDEVAVFRWPPQEGEDSHDATASVASGPPEHRRSAAQNIAVKYAFALRFGASGPMDVVEMIAYNSPWNAGLLREEHGDMEEAVRAAGDLLGKPFPSPDLLEDPPE